jgi:hypothetical protein
MEYNNNNEIHQFEQRNIDTSKIELLNHLKNISSANSNFNKPEIVKPKSSLSSQMEGLSFEEQKEMLNKMAASGTTNRINEYVGKRYSLDDIKKLNVGVVESVKMLINEAAVAPRMDMKSVSVMVDDFYKSTIDKPKTAPAMKKTSMKRAELA